MFCPSCGAQNIEGVKFCKTCGKPLEAASAPAAPATTQSAPAASVPQQSAPSYGTAAASSNGKNGGETAAFVLAIIAIVLTFIPIPFISWLTGPCAVISFGLAFNIWYLSKRANKEVPVKMILVLVFAGYAMLNILTSNMAGGGGLEAIASGLGSFLGSMY